MRYLLLGPLEVISDLGEPVVIRTPKRRALLAILVLHANRRIARDRLIDLLWGADPPDAAVNSLHAHLSRLRGDLAADVIETSAAGYRVRVEPGELDLEVFEASIEQARRARSEGRWADASEALTAGLGLFRGPVLADLAEESFAQAEIARVEELRLTALEDRIDADLHLGRVDGLAARLEALVVAHPLRERLWGQLMLVLYRTGRQADALAAYQRLRRALLEDLGIDPAPELRELQRRILRHDPALAVTDMVGGPAPDRLPVPDTSFVGRASQVAAVIHTLDDHRLVTLTGPGGVGKTRLALAVAEATAARYPDGVVFVDLAAIRDPAAVSERIGAAVGGGQRPSAVIQGRRMLLVLDNFEQVIEAAPLISALLHACPSLRVIVTSRVPLRVRGERAVDVPPLDDSAAAALFVDRAEAALASSTFHPQVVADLVAGLDGLPLAVELAAARIRVLSPEAIRDRLSDRLSLLAGGPRDVPDRHRTLRETIAWSYELLSPRQQAAFRKLSVLAPMFDLDAALAVAETDLEGIAALVDHSLVRRIDDRYSMLETIREFAAGEAAAHDEGAAARDRHLAHFAPLPLRWRGGLANAVGRDFAWLERCARDRENFRLAYDWAVQRRDAEAAVELFTGMGMYWLFLGASERGASWADEALDLARDLDPARRLPLLDIASEFPRFAGDLRRALAIKQEALALYRARQDLRGVSNALDDIGWIHAALDDYAKAWAALDESRAIHDRERPCPPTHRAHTLWTSIEVLVREGRADEALPLLDAFAAASTGSEQWPDWVVGANLLHGQVFHAIGRDEKAATAFREAIAVGSQMEYKQQVAEALDGLAGIAAAADPQAAARLLGMADRLRAEARSSSWIPHEREATLGLVRRRLGPELSARLVAEGHAMTLGAIAEAVLGTV